MPLYTTHTDTHFILTSYSLHTIHTSTNTKHAKYTKHMRYLKHRTTSRCTVGSHETGFSPIWGIGFTFSVVVSTSTWVYAPRVKNEIPAYLSLPKNFINLAVEYCITISVHDSVDGEGIPEPADSRVHVVGYDNFNRFIKKYPVVVRTKHRSDKQGQRDK